MSKQYTIVQHPVIKAANRRISMAVRIYRNHRGMTEQTLANLLEIPCNSLSRMELGKQQWPAALIPTLSLYLDVDPMAFFFLGKPGQDETDINGKKLDPIDVSKVKKIIKQLTEIMDNYEEVKEIPAKEIPAIDTEEKIQTMPAIDTGKEVQAKPVINTNKKTKIKEIPVGLSITRPRGRPSKKPKTTV